MTKRTRRVLFNLLVAQLVGEYPGMLLGQDSGRVSG
ncbi:hypothetical protein M2277_000609 [Paenibacillus sp. LBL]|nr:hypothetical protein [Paenibacillus sp. LBL]